MRRFFLVLTGAAVVAAVVGAAAADEQTVVGQVIDLTCYARMGKATGATYDECARKNARAGAILGILTEETVYTISGEMTNNENAKLLGFLGKTVEATGTVTDGGGPGTRLIGKHTIDVSSMKTKAR